MALCLQVPIHLKSLWYFSSTFIKYTGHREIHWSRILHKANVFFLRNPVEGYIKYFTYMNRRVRGLHRQTQTHFPNPMWQEDASFTNSKYTMHTPPGENEYISVNVSLFVIYIIYTYLILQAAHVLCSEGLPKLILAYHCILFWFLMSVIRQYKLWLGRALNVRVELWEMI